MAKTIQDKNLFWNTIHNNGSEPLGKLYQTSLDDSFRNKLDKYNDSCKEIRRLINKTLKEGKRFRAYGSKWSLSKIAYQKDVMHHNNQLNIHIPIEAEDLELDSKHSYEDFFLFQCGNKISEISETLKSYKKSLSTSGASNGQTIAGAVSTGVHGSTIDFGSIQDSVVGIHLIIGPFVKDVVYIERESSPVCNIAFTKKIKSRFIRDDDLFNAALVGLGSFGFLMGVVLKVEDIYLLKRYTKPISKPEAMKLATTLDFENSNFKISEELDENGKQKRPFHFKIYINPYNDSKDLIAEVMFKKPYNEDYINPIPQVIKFLPTDLSEFLSVIAQHNNWIIPRIIRALKGTIFPKIGEESIGTLADIFWDTKIQGAAFAWSFGVDLKDTEKAYNSLANLVKSKGPFPGAIAIRFVKATEATLGFTKFPYTSIIDMDGIQWSPSSSIMSMQEIQSLIIKEFKKNNIEFTIHWGKNAAWNFPGLVDYMYGDRDDEWKKQRSSLLRKECADLFSNRFLEEIGLSEYRKDIIIV